MSNALEETEQVALCNWLRLNKIEFFAVPNGGKRNAIEMKNMKRSGLRVGASDMVVFTDKRILFIELKRKPITTKKGNASYSNSVTSPEQLEFIEMANKYPYAKAKVCYGYVDSIKFIEEWL